MSPQHGTRVRRSALLVALVVALAAAVALLWGAPKDPRQQRGNAQAERAQARAAAAKSSTAIDKPTNAWPSPVRLLVMPISGQDTRDLHPAILQKLASSGLALVDPRELEQELDRRGWKTALDAGALATLGEALKANVILRGQLTRQGDELRLTSELIAPPLKSRIQVIGLNEAELAARLAQRVRLSLGVVASDGHRTP